MSVTGFYILARGVIPGVNSDAIVVLEEDGGCRLYRIKETDFDRKTADDLVEAGLLVPVSGMPFSAVPEQEATPKPHCEPVPPGPIDIDAALEALKVPPPHGPPDPKNLSARYRGHVVDEHLREPDGHNLITHRYGTAETSSKQTRWRLKWYEQKYCQNPRCGARFKSRDARRKYCDRCKCNRTGRKSVAR